MPSFSGLNTFGSFTQASAVLRPGLYHISPSGIRTDILALRDFCLIDFFRNSLLLRKLMIFEQIDRQIFPPYVNIWWKNLTIKMPKMAILTTKWSFERSLIFVIIPEGEK